MPTVRAYCTACDTEIQVRIPDEGLDVLELGDLDCPHAELCGTEACVLGEASPSLREFLDFLPPGEGSQRTRDLKGATRLVEDARRASMAREIRRWRQWWGGR